jgi:Zn-dependent M28 family amino/carboxypeptidase
MRIAVLSAICVSLILACNSEGRVGDGAPSRADIEPALNAIDTTELLADIKRLSSDGFEGRAPGSRGEDSTVAFLTARFKQLGLAAGNPNGTYEQDVPLVGLKQTVSASFHIGGKTITPKQPDDYFAASRRVAPEVKVEGSDLVFVGYGVVAPEYGWDDYKDVDVKGKTIVMLVNDPAIPDPADSTKLDNKMFNGRAMTYYGRWTYKYEIAAEKGAAAAIVVHETGPAGYPFQVLTAGWGQESFDIKPADNNMGRVAVQAWVSTDMARKMFTASGKNFDEMKKAALRKDFRPVDLGGKANFRIKSSLREVQSKNVVAKLEGGARKDEYVVYTAHWDHLGRDSMRQGDQIFNGAIDNASGTAGLLQLAEAFAKLPSKPDRSIVFLVVTAEEKGLLGAKYYAKNPLYPLEKTVANINIDGLNQWGKTEDLIVVGLGNSTLDDVLTEAAKSQGRTIGPDAEPEKGFFYRSDHFEFAKEGVPALYTDAGVKYVGRDSTYGQAKRDEYTNNDYHKPSDEVKPDWDLSGAVADLHLLFELGYRVSQTLDFPTWKPGTEFKARRDSAMAAKR